MKQSIASLEKRLKTLQMTADTMRNQISMREEMLTNSFASIMETGFAQSGLTSFNPIAENNVYGTISNNPMLLTFFYKSNGIMQTAIDMPVQDALRDGLDIEIPEGDDDDLKRLNDALENMGFYHTMKEADIWTWVYGGGGLIVQDETDPAKPLDVKRLANRQLKFYAANRWELSGPTRFAKKYNFYGQSVDGSRVITMIGKDAPYILKWVVSGWGMSKIEALIEPINIYLRTQNAVYDLLKEAKVDVFQFEQFASLLATQKGEQQALRRIQIMNQAKSNSNAVVMDAKDKFEQKQIIFAGLAQIWQENRISLASNLRIPMAKLFGLSASGFASGEDDIENYNAMVQSDIREHLKPTLRAALDLVVINTFGELIPYNFKFKALRVMSSVEEEQVKTSKQNRYAAQYQQGMLTAKEYAHICKIEGLIPIETEVLNGAEPEPLFDETNGGETSDDEEAA